MSVRRNIRAHGGSLRDDSGRSAASNTNREDSPQILTKRILACIILAVSYAFPIGQLAGGLINLANDRVSLSFDDQTGGLIRIKNLSTGDEYLKGPPAGGNSFRAYVDTKEILPPAAKAGMPFSVTPVEDGMGGAIVDPKNCKVIRIDRGKGPHLIIESRHAKTGLRFKLRVALPPKSHTATLELRVVNTSPEKRRVMVALPYLTGLALGPDRGTNRGVHLRGWGKAGGPAWTRQGGMYGGPWNMQWNAVYEPALDEGLGIISIDRKMVQKPGRLFRRFAPSGLSVLHYPAAELAPGQGVDIMPAQILVHRGNWRVVAKEYRQKIKGYIKPRVSPDWFRLYPAGSWLNFPNPADTAAAKARGEAPTFAKLMPKRAAGTFYRTQGYGWQQEFMRDGIFATYHAGYDRIRDDLGGAASLRDGVAATKKLGRKPFVTVATVSIHPDAHWLKGKNPRDYWLMDSPEATFPGDTPRRNFFADVRYEPYQDHFAAMIGRLLTKTGLDGIYLDEGGGDYYGPNYNKSFAERSPFALGEKYPGIAFHRKLRAAVEAANPGAVITSENKNEMTLPFLDGAHMNTHPGREIQPFRLVYPEFSTECMNGGIPALLNNHGSIVRDIIAYESKVGFGDAHQESIKGVGIHAIRPAVLDTLSLDEIRSRTPLYRYAELRPTLREWAYHGDASNDDPVAVGIPESRAEEFVGRLWMAPNYWLLTAGHFAGWKQSKPTVFKLPKLPAAITSAHEYDLETLDLEPTALTRKGGNIHVTINHGFSAVLLPMPTCPPLIQFGEPPPEVLRRGESYRLQLESIAPWLPNKRRELLDVTLAFPGLELGRAKLQLPGSVELTVPADTLSGHYYFSASAESSLPLWRVLRVE